jgi:branched-chain amino acid transport system ATP-binding protein
VLENLRLGAYSRFSGADGGSRLAQREALSPLGRLQHHLFQAATGGIRDLARGIREYRQRRQDFEAALRRVFDYFPILAERKSQIAGTLSGGEQQMLAIGRGLMARPRLLLLDEPSMGLAPMVTREIFQIIQAINQTQGVTIVVVEQNANLALDIADYGYVLETGRIALADTSENLRKSEAVQRSYLGQ